MSYPNWLHLPLKCQGLNGFALFIEFRCKLVLSWGTESVVVASRPQRESVRPRLLAARERAVRLLAACTSPPRDLKPSRRCSTRASFGPKPSSLSVGPPRPGFYVFWLDPSVYKAA